MKILFLGDFYFDYDYIPEDIISISDYIEKNKLVTILNLEGSIKSKTQLNKGTCLSFSDKYIEVLKLLNVRAVNLANNHIMDYGEEGLRKIMKQLDEAGIGYFGAGLNLIDACKPYILECDGKKIALFGQGWNMEECVNATNKSPGTSPLDFKMMNNIVNNVEVDFCVSVLHMGYEFESLPQPLHVKECRNLIKNKKVRLIIGHHPHVIQAYENHIFYSLGNFYFGNRRDSFYKHKDIKGEPNYGLGVIYCPQKNNINILNFMYDGTKTFMVEKCGSNNFIDISSIFNYNKFFYKNNTFRNRKYVYKTGFFNEYFTNIVKYKIRNGYKLYLRRIKWPFIKKIKVLMKRK